MCEFAGRLMAWLDDELPAGDAAAVKRHLEDCPECRGRVEAYREVCSAFDGYCDSYCEAVVASGSHRRLPRRIITVSGALAVAAAAAAIFLFAPRTRVHPSLLRAAQAPSPAGADVAKALPPVHSAEPAAAVIKPDSRIERRKPAQHERPMLAQRQGEETGWLPSEPAFEIAIPADAIFPPGALPEGVGFTADVTIAPDGSAQQVRLRPQLTEFERRSTRP